MGRRLTAAKGHNSNGRIGVRGVARRPFLSLTGRIALACIAAMVATGCESTSLGMRQFPLLNLTLASRDTPPVKASDPFPPTVVAKPIVRNEIFDAEHHDFAGNLVAARAAALDGDEEMAVETFYQLVDEYPRRYEPYHHLAVMADCDGRDGEAAILYRQAADLHQSDPEVFFDLGLFLLDRGRFEEAEPALARAIELAPAQPRYRRELATLHVHQARYEEALAQLAAGRTEAEAFYELALILDEQGNQTVMRDCLVMAVEADPEHQAARQALRALDQRGKPNPSPADAPTLADHDVRPIVSSLSMAPEDVHSPRPVSYEAITSDRRSHVNQATTPLR